MNTTADLFNDRHESYKGAFVAALAAHVAVVLAIALPRLLSGDAQVFGAKDAGGAIGVNVTNKIPLIRRAQNNPVANDSESEVPTAPSEGKRAIEKTNPKAIPLLPAKKTSTREDRPRLKSYSSLVENQEPSRLKQAAGSPIYSEASGAGQIGTGMKTTLGSRFGAYAQQIRDLVAQNWRTNDVDARLNRAPVVVATFELRRDGTITTPRLLERSGNSALDFSVTRAILDAAPFPPIPAGFDKSSAIVEFTFELKR
jgi:protein TonB